MRMQFLTTYVEITMDDRTVFALYADFPTKEDAIDECIKFLVQGKSGRVTVTQGHRKIN